MAGSGPGRPTGQPKTGGRVKGVPNKKSLEFQEILERNQFDPGQALIEIYKEQMQIFRFRKKKMNLQGASEVLAEAQVTVNNICQYVYPKKKAIEHTGEVGVKTFADFIAASKPNK